MAFLPLPLKAATWFPTEVGDAGARVGQLLLLFRLRTCLFAECSVRFLGPIGFYGIAIATGHQFDRAMQTFDGVPRPSGAGLCSCSHAYSAHTHSSILDDG